jgi:Mn2+/Fe2+ NRAMP family transporter
MPLFLSVVLVVVVSTGRNNETKKRHFPPMSLLDQVSGVRQTSWPALLTLALCSSTWTTIVVVAMRPVPLRLQPLRLASLLPLQTTSWLCLCLCVCSPPHANPPA